jgi:hypothetical protein
VQIHRHASVDQYQGPVRVVFESDETVSVVLGDGRIVDVSHDGTWQLSAPAAADGSAQLLASGAFGDAAE